MGVTVFYRGAIADADRVEDLEDRVLDLALQLGGAAQIWRSSCDEDPQRVVRGLIVDLVPGQETTSLLISPEGWLVGLTEIEDAEAGRLTEPPWCFVKTQFGSVEGHVALIELLDALKKEFIPNLEVTDEAGYWESRDLSQLQQQLSFVQSAIDGFADGLRRYGLSAEAAEDPQIVVARVERIAQHVQRTIARPAEHPPVRFGGDDDELDWDELPPGTEAEWDAMFNENRRKQERLGRAIEERIQQGEDAGEAFENALRDEGIIDLPGEEPIGEAAHEFEESIEPEPDEPWKESLPEAIREDEEDTFDNPRRRHPLLQRSMDLLHRLFELSKDMERTVGSHLSILHRGAGELMGGLAQALSPSGIDAVDLGLACVQLKRALRGAAFARGALFPLRSEALFDETVFNELRLTIDELEKDIFSQLADVRARMTQDDR